MLKKELEELVKKQQQENEDLQQQLNDLDLCYAEAERQIAAITQKKIPLMEAWLLINDCRSFLDNKELLTDPLRDAFTEYTNYELERWVKKYEK